LQKLYIVMVLVVSEEEKTGNQGKEKEFPNNSPTIASLFRDWIKIILIRYYYIHLDEHTNELI
jgi:hypothetical protein